MTGATAQTAPRTCVCTVASRNHIHAVRTLMDSVANFAPGVDRVLGLCDQHSDTDSFGDAFDVIDLTEIDLPDRQQLIFQYTQFELNCAIKPYVVAKIFDRGYDKVIYFDSDIEVYDALDDMIARLDHADVLLTPHITSPLTDAGHPGERELMASGTFNLGFFAMRRSEATANLVSWWQQKLERDCVVDFEHGLFTDQKWMDFAPSLCERHEIVRHSGWNVAYWNLPNRKFDQDGDSFTVNSMPLVFFHFSGFDPTGGEFSRHQNRYTMSTVPSAVRTLAQGYAAKLEEHSHSDTKHAPYTHANFADGTFVPDVVRRIYRNNRDELAVRFPDPGGANAAEFIQYINEPFVRHGRSSPLISRVMWEIHRRHPDLFLEDQFPDVLGAHARSFAEWFVGAGCGVHELPEIFVRPVREALDEDGDPVTSEKMLAKWIYRTAWRFKDLSGFLPFKLRRQIAATLFRRAYVSDAETGGMETGYNAMSSYPNGINILGYLQGELGIGEAARSTLRSCAAAGVSAAAIDFTRGLPHRREEDIPGNFADDPKFGVTLLHLNAEQVQHVCADRNDVLRDRYVVGFWNWELPELPDEWLDGASFLNEVWAPTHFCQVAFSRKLKIPVAHVPYSIDVAVPPDIGRCELGLPEDDFIFMQTFDCFSTPERKNPMAAVEAYQRAKPSFRRNTRLVIKLINSDKETKLRKSLRVAVDRDDSIIVIDRYLRRPELNALFNSVDSYISLHRSEGYGLTLAESMFLGKPVIATGWSGNMDFMTPWNSLPVPYRLIQIERDHGPYAAGQWWAEPDIDAAATAMIRVANDSDYASEIGINAARDMRENNSPAAVGRIIQARLNAITQQQM